MTDIEEKRKSTIESLRHEYDARKGEYIISSEKRVADLRGQFEKKIKDESAEIRAKESSIIDLEEKRIVLERRNQLIDSGLKQAEAALELLAKSKEYKEILSSMFSAGSKLLGEKATFFLYDGDLNNSQHKENAKKLVRQSRIAGGLVASSPDGRMEVDLTFDTIFREIREDLALELANRIREA